MSATVRRRGQGYSWSCDECPRSFLVGGVFSSPDIEGHRIMQRDADQHNRKHHASTSEVAS